MGPNDDIIYDCVLRHGLAPTAIQDVLQKWASALALTHTPALTYGQNPTDPPTIGTLQDDVSGWCTDRGVVYVVLRETAVRRLDSESLAALFFGLGFDLDLILGRTVREGFAMCVRPEEVAPEGALTGLGWFQYFGPEIAGRWPPEVWEPFRTMRGNDGAVGLILGDDPLQPRIRDAAEALGLSIRPLYGRNPATGEPFLIPHL
jgi:hypothetical protein